MNANGVYDSRSEEYDSAEQGRSSIMGREALDKNSEELTHFGARVFNSHLDERNVGFDLSQLDKPLPSF